MVVVVAILLLVGGSRIPKLARSLGSAKSEFEEGLKKSPEGGSSNGTSAAAATDATTPAPQPAPAPPGEGTSQTS